MGHDPWVQVGGPVVTTAFVTTLPCLLGDRPSQPGHTISRRMASVASVASLNHAGQFGWPIGSLAESRWGGLRPHVISV
jgi:hypothetical protein